MDGAQYTEPHQSPFRFKALGTASGEVVSQPLAWSSPRKLSVPCRIQVLRRINRSRLETLDRDVQCWKVATRVRLITDLWFVMLMSTTQPLMVYDRGGSAITAYQTTDIIGWNRRLIRPGGY